MQKTAKRLVCLATFCVLASLAIAQTGQGLDTGGNAFLNGNYFFRWVISSNVTATGAFGKVTSLLGTIRFDGNGGYQITGQMADSSVTPVAAKAYTASGKYVVSSGGMAEIQNPVFAGDSIYAGVGTEAVVGSSTDNRNYDVFVAIPAPSGGGSTKSVQGSYKLGMQEFIAGNSSLGRTVFLDLSADGNGAFATFTPAGDAANSSVLRRNSIAGATYSIGSDGSGTMNFPLPATSSANSVLVSGTKVFYVSADGQVVLGGSASGFDIVVGFKALAGTGAAPYSGIYYFAGFEHDASSTGPFDESFHGVRNAQPGYTYYYERDNAAPGDPENHFDYTQVYTAETFTPAGVGSDTNYYRILGAGGQMYFVAGKTADLLFSVGVQVRPFTAASGPSVSPYGVVNAATLIPSPNPLSPGEFISIFGSGFAAAATNASTVPLPTTLGNVQVKINGRLAALSFAGPNQINALVPYATKEPYANLQVIVNNQTSNTVSTYMNATAQGVYTVPPGGTGSPAMLHADYSLVTASNPAKAGETVLLFLTGLGNVTPAVPDGSAAPSATLSTVPTTVGLGVVMGNSDAPVSFAGLAPGFAGLYQLNVKVPSDIATSFTTPGPTVQNITMNVYSTYTSAVSYLPVTNAK